MSERKRRWLKALFIDVDLKCIREPAAGKYSMAARGRRRYLRLENTSIEGKA